MPDMSKWLVTTFHQAAPFSLRATRSTSWAASSLLLPTPYAVKMGLLDAAFRRGDGARVETLFNLLKGRTIRFRPPNRLAVTGTLVRILREPKNKKEAKDPFIPSVAYREFVEYAGPLQIATDIADLDRADVAWLADLFRHVNYWGKRGGFFTWSAESMAETLTDDFTVPVIPAKPEASAPWSLDAMFQELDDIGEKASWPSVNTYSEASAKLGRDRVLVATLIPMRRVATVHNRSLYVRLGEER